MAPFRYLRQEMNEAHAEKGRLLRHIRWQNRQVVGSQEGAGEGGRLRGPAGIAGWRVVSLPRLELVGENMFLSMSALQFPGSVCMNMFVSQREI